MTSGESSDERRDATVERRAAGRVAVRLERLLDVDRDTCWRSITDRELLRTWFPCDVEVLDGSWRIAAELRFTFDASVGVAPLHGEVLALDPGRSLTYSWGDEVLSFMLTSDELGTWLALEDELSASIAARNAAGWEDCLDKLSGRTPQDGAWRRSFERYARAFEPIAGAQEGPPSSQ